MSVGDRLEFAVKVAPFVSLRDAVAYGLLAGAAWMVFRVVFRRAFEGRRISDRGLAAGQISREVLHSVRSIAIFGLVGGFVVFAALSGWTRFYRRIDDHGWPWFFASIALMVLLHDAYFYWTHRLMHHRRLFRFFHRTYHLSTNPTPWAAYAFGPWEAFVQAGIGPLIAFTIPVHPAAFLPFMLWQITFNVLGHGGYEIFPARFLQTPLGRFLNSPTHHALHHEKFRGNYSLYFNVWDRLMGTNHRSYEERFALATAGGAAEPLRIEFAADPEPVASPPAVSSDVAVPVVSERS